MTCRERLLVVFVDALGPEQLARLRPAIGSLEHVRALRGVLGYSSGALATLLTGASPVEHGRMCLFSARDGEARSVLDPLRFLGLVPRFVHERAGLRRLAARALSRWAGLTGYLALHRVPPEAFRWLDIPERDDLFSAEALGRAPTFLAEARAAGLSVYTSPWQLPEQARWEHAHATLRRSPPDLAFLYCAELDATLHEGGNQGAKVAPALARIAAHVGRARDEMARGAGRFTTLIVGDHGMADVRSVRDPRAFLRELAPERAFVDSTMLRLWGPPRLLQSARGFTRREGWPGTWLDTPALVERKVPTVGSPYGDAIFVLDEGALFAPSFVGGRARGMHGYDLGAPSARAALASDAPLGSVGDELASVAPFIRERLGISP